MNVLVVDDEPLARERLVRLLEGDDRVTQCITASSGLDALNSVDTHHIDLVLLDIRMPGVNGLEVAELLAERHHPPAIVFCTAYDDYALDAFRVNAVSYLLKPVKREALSTVIGQAGQLNQAQLSALTHEDEGPVLSLQTGRGRERIPITDVYFFRADQKYVMAQCCQGERLCELSLKQLEERWPNHLIRVHRNTLVPRQRLEKLSRDGDGGYWLTVRGADEALPVSRRFARVLKPLFEEG